MGDPFTHAPRADLMLFNLLFRSLSMYLTFWQMIKEYRFEISSFVGAGIVDAKYTAIVRRSKMEYVALCLELNVSSRGTDLVDVEKNLRAAIELYLEDMREFPDTMVSSVSSEELIEFFKDTEPDDHAEAPEGLLLRTLEVHEVPSYA
jgi:predicted RNase H-like HicB family nuclease